MNTILSILGVIAILAAMVPAFAHGLDKQISWQEQKDKLHCEQYPEKRAGGYCG